MPQNPSGQLPDRNVGALRWSVDLYRRDQVPNPNGPGIVESYTAIATGVHADVQPAYLSTVINSVAVDTPISHIITARWLDYVENTNVIFRTVARPSDGSFRTELFRVRRVKELAGRHRFSQFECELEAVRTTPDDTMASRLTAFAEGVMSVPAPL